MKIEAGKYYVERNGAIHGPIKPRERADPDDPYVWEAGRYHWTVDGRWQIFFLGDPMEFSPDEPHDLMWEFRMPNVAEAVAAERAACVRIVESHPGVTPGPIWNALTAIAAAIRARGEKEMG